jgi:hypothetical protein
MEQELNDSYAALGALASLLERGSLCRQNEIPGQWIHLHENGPVAEP